nr:PRAME family member 8-like [Meriones unguiculatus]
MSFQAPPTLLTLAVQSLLKDEALAISALQDLPMELFPPLFKAAFDGRQLKILKAMVAAWPFPCLPVGALKFPDVATLKAVLDGIDMQLTGNFCQRVRKLQVLDLRNVHHDFWDVWARTEDGDHSAEIACERQRRKRLHRYALRQHLKVVTDICLGFHLDEHQAYLLQWAQKRRGSLHLCCVKMQIWGLRMDTLGKFLSIFQPDSFEELELSIEWTPSMMEHFAPCLGQMRNLHKLFLTLKHENFFRPVITPTALEGKRATKFISHFSKLNCLQYLYMTGVYFLNGHMRKLLWCLKTPLEFLSIALCKFSQSDLESFVQCQSLCHLKHLDLAGVNLSGLSLVPLRIFLESVADTLQTLELEHCRMNDSQLSALFPALSRCSQLIKINFYDNDISMAVLKDLLCHTANLGQLILELYPAPLECYETGYVISIDRFVQLSSELRNTLCAVRQPQSFSFATFICLECCQRSSYDAEMTLCLCWQ